jgi:hypothetical protein
VQVTGGGQSYRYHVDRKDLAEVSPAGQVGQDQVMVLCVYQLKEVGRGGGELGREWTVGLLCFSTLTNHAPLTMGVRMFCTQSKLAPRTQHTQYHTLPCIPPFPASIS